MRFAFGFGGGIVLDYSNREELFQKGLLQ
jgi:hypothetical protein